MNTDRQDPRFRSRLAWLIVAGLLVIGALGGLLALTAGKSIEAQGPARQYYMRMSLLLAAFLGMTVVALAWMLIHRIARRLQPPPKKTKYVDAWKIAGERLKVDDSQDESDSGGAS